MSAARSSKRRRPRQQPRRQQQQQQQQQQQRQQKTLTIEFSGICTLVWNKASNTVDVHLVDLASAGFQRHFAGLSFEVTESTPRSIKGPDADAAVSVAGADKDIGIWNLLGTTVEIVGATGPLTVDDGPVDATKRPGATAASIRWLANVGSLCESRRIDPVCPTAAIIRIPAGHVMASGPAAARKVEFVNDGAPVEPDRYCMPRFKAIVPFTDELVIRLTRERVLRFGDSMKVVISNTCVCGLGVEMGPAANHFYAHYDIVRAKRRPQVKRAGKNTAVPWNPEFCFSGFVESGDAP